MTTKEDFIRRYNVVKEDVIKALDDALKKAVGNKALDYDKMKGNYNDVCPLIGAALQRQLHFILEVGRDERTERRQKRQADVYRKDFRIWHDYAGDYKGSGCELKDYQEYDVKIGEDICELSDERISEIITEFAEHGFDVSKEAIMHNFDAWRAGLKSGYRDKERGYHLFSPCGCNPLRFSATSLCDSCHDWQKTYFV